jgi:hypothetical protein
MLQFSKNEISDFSVKFHAEVEGGGTAGTDDLQEDPWALH